MQPLWLLEVGPPQVGWPESTVPQEAGLQGFFTEQEGWQLATGWQVKDMEEAGWQCSAWQGEDTQQVGLQELNAQVGGWQGTGTWGNDWQVLKM